MLALFALIFWITISGANVPSRWIAHGLIEQLYPWLRDGAAGLGLPWWLRGVLIDGMYLATAWLISVMLPPMAIFFPLFSLLEDFGYLPRVAFNLDKLFKSAGAHGKQAMSTMMGFGCNAAGSWPRASSTARASGDRDHPTISPLQQPLAANRHGLHQRTRAGATGGTDLDRGRDGSRCSAWASRFSRRGAVAHGAERQPTFGCHRPPRGEPRRSCAVRAVAGRGVRAPAGALIWASANIGWAT